MYVPLSSHNGTQYLHCTGSRLSEDVSPRGPPYVSSLRGATISRETELAPIYRVLDSEGQIINPSEDPHVSNGVQ